MKKFLQRVLGMVIAISGLSYNFCYADEIDPMFPYEPSTINIVPIIIIGVVIIVIVVTAIMILIKSKKDKEKNDKK